MKTFILLLLACLASTASAKHLPPQSKIAHYFESAGPEEKFAFLLAMPKGGELDAEMPGSVYAESMIAWAAKKGLCMEEDMSLSMPPCTEGKLSARAVLSDPALYRKTLGAWSMRGFEGKNPDHFFSSFGKFEQATQGMTGAMLAEMLSRAAKEHVIYLEVALAPGGKAALALGKRLGWDGNLHNTLENLKNNGLSKIAAASLKEMKLAEAEKNQRLKCGTIEADPGCSVSIRYLYNVSRNTLPGEVFAQMATGLELASRPDSGFSGILLSGAEDESMPDFSLHMQMLDFLKSVYPKTHVAVNAGELSLELAPPEDLSFHISEAVMLGHAERIGQGSDILHEPQGLLQKLAQKKVLVDICPGRIDTVLGEYANPVTTYLKYGVPVALSGCDAGVLRSEISMEYLKASLEDHLGYPELRNIARNSLEYAFVPGKSLWVNAAKFVPVRQCARDVRAGRLLSDFCQDYLESNRKAKLEWQLEAEFRAFEKRY